MRLCHYQSIASPSERPGRWLQQSQGLGLAHAESDFQIDVLIR